MSPTGLNRSTPNLSARRWLPAVAAVALLGAACGGGSDSLSADPAGAEDGQPTILATTSIWADVVNAVACDSPVTAVALIPPGGDPHAFEPSLADRGDMDSAALIVANGLFLEESLEDALDASEAEGTVVARMGDFVSTIEYGAGEGHGHEGDDEHSDDEHSDDEHSDDEHSDDEHSDDEHSDDEHSDEDKDHTDEDEHGHEEGSGDPHIWFDPQRVSDALPALGEQLIDAAELDRSAVEACIADYQSELAAVDAEITELVEAMPVDQRVLVTNHDSLGYFAERYDFEVVGTVIPSSSGLAETNPAQLAELAETIENAGVSAIFAETQRSTDDAEALAAEVGVDVVSLLTGTLGEDEDNDTYIEFLRFNATAITNALTADGGS